MKPEKTAVKLDMPETMSDMTVEGKTAGGRLLCVWRDFNRDRVEVPATPRALRPSLLEDASPYSRAAALETTPERALRKMRNKIVAKRAQTHRGDPTTEEAQPLKKLKISYPEGVPTVEEAPPLPDRIYGAPTAQVKGASQAKRCSLLKRSNHK